MQLHRRLHWILCVPALLLATACGATRDVDVTGEVTPASNAAGDDPIRLEFSERMEPEKEGEEGKLELVHTATLEEAGAFDEKVPMSGDELFVVAVVDADGNEACTDGEAWGTIEATIDEDDGATLELGLESKATCPALDIAE